MPATQPTLGLPTMNRQCEAVRAAHRVALASEALTLSPAELDKALQMIELARGWLQEAYKVLKPHPVLSIQCELAGRASKTLINSVELRRKGAP